MHREDDGAVMTAYWSFDDLREELLRKHPSTLWVSADVVAKGSERQPALFRYVRAEFSRSPQFTTFLRLIEESIVTYDWRGYTSPNGSYKGKNHGNVWRIDRHFKQELFDSIVPLDL